MFRLLRDSESKCSLSAWFHLAEVCHLYNLLNVEFVHALARWLRPYVQAQSPIIEVCAGDGLLTHWLRKVGVPVVAVTDGDTSAENHWTRTDHSERVECLDAVEAARKYQPEIVLASWVPYRFDIAWRVLDCPSVEKLVWIGEGDGGCCGDEKIWEYPHEPLQEAGRWLLSRTDFAAAHLMKHGWCVAFGKPRASTPKPSQDSEATSSTPSQAGHAGK